MPTKLLSSDTWRNRPEQLLTLTLSSKRRGNFLPLPARERAGVRVV